MEIYIILVYMLSYIGLFAVSFYIINLFTYYKTKKIPKENTKKSVTIVIPAYNEEQSIKRTIESALSLDYPKEKFEIIVVSDGSTDKTYEIAKSMESTKNPEVKVFKKENGGKGSALNVGIKKASGEIIITMDADTFVHPNALKKMVGFFVNETVMSVTPSMGVYQPKTILQRVQQIEYYMGTFLRKSFASVNAVHITPGAFSCYRKKFFLKHGYFDERNITEDLEIALRIQSHDYIIENAPQATIYTIAPATFKPLLIQRRRWYTGLIKNLWTYRRLFGIKKGALGTIVLPTAVITITLSVILTVYTIAKSLLRIKQEIVTLNAINFKFESIIELNDYVIRSFLTNLFSNNIFLLSILFLSLLWFYMNFSRKQMKYEESIKLSFFLFACLYSLLFTFWWITSATYVLLNKSIVWRGNKK